MKPLYYFFLSIIFCIYSCKKESTSENVVFKTGIGEDTTIILAVNSSYKVNIVPENANVSIDVNVDRTYKSPRTGVISVSESGQIKALEEGKASVTFKNNTGYSTFNVVVVTLPSKIELKDSLICIKTGEDFQLATNKDYDQYELTYFGGIKWETTDQSVASASNLGKLTALKEGNTLVRISLVNFPNIYSEYSIQTFDHNVYLAGDCIMENNYSHNYIFKNNVPVEPNLDNIASVIYGMEYSNESFYLIGATTNSGQAFLSKNSSAVTFAEEDAHAKGLALMGNDIYTSGYYTKYGIRTVALWKNSELIPILSDTETITKSESTCITTSNGDIYIGGYIEDSWQRIGCYWKNKQRTELKAGISYVDVSSMFIDGNDVYVASSYENVVNNSNVYTACYFKNGVKNDLPSGMTSTTSIYVYNSDVYVAGMYRNSQSQWVACYCKNDVKYDLPLPSGTVYSTTISLKVIDGDVYISGNHSNGINFTGCYWKNGIIHDIPTIKLKDGSIYPYSYVNCMAID